MKIDKKTIDLYRNDVCRFANDVIYLEPNKKLTLWGWQEEVLKKCVEKDESGKHKHPISIISLPRRNGKTLLSAILSLHELFHGGYNTKILTLGVGAKEVSQIALNLAKILIKNSPLLYDSISSEHLQRDIIYLTETDSYWEIRPTSLIHTYGSGYSLIHLDELAHGAVHLSEDQKLFDSISASQAAEKNPRIVISSTVNIRAGTMYSLMEESNRNSKIYLFYTNDNLSPLITKEFLAERERVMYKPDFNKWHRNIFFSGANNFIPDTLWEAAVDPQLQPVTFKPSGEFWSVSALDLGLRHDLTAICTVYQKHDKIYLGEIKTWNPQETGEVQVQWVVDYLLDAKKRLNTKMVYADEWQAMSLIQSYGTKLGMKGTHLTSTQLEKIWLNFHRKLSDGKIKIYDDGSEEMKRMKLEALNLQIESRGQTYKVLDAGPGIHNDLILSFAMAVYALTETYEKEALRLRGTCLLTKWGIERCPLYHPEIGKQLGFEVVCHECDKYHNAVLIVKDRLKITENLNYWEWDEKLLEFSERVGGFSLGRVAIIPRSL